MIGSVVCRWFPAALRRTGTATLRRVYLLGIVGGPNPGLHVFTRPAEVGDELVPVDWAQVPAMPEPRHLRNGVDLPLSGGGTATVTLGQGCRCGPLGHWAGPSWAHQVTVGGAR